MGFENGIGYVCFPSFFAKMCMAYETRVKSGRLVSGW